jgi:hypothetical protein
VASLIKSQGQKTRISAVAGESGFVDAGQGPDDIAAILIGASTVSSAFCDFRPLPNLSQRKHVGGIRFKEVQT